MGHAGPNQVRRCKNLAGHVVDEIMSTSGHTAALQWRTTHPRDPTDLPNQEPPKLLMMPCLPLAFNSLSLYLSPASRPSNLPFGGSTTHLRVHSERVRVLTRHVGINLIQRKTSPVRLTCCTDDARCSQKQLSCVANTVSPSWIHSFGPRSMSTWSKDTFLAIVTELQRPRRKSALVVSASTNLFNMSQDTFRSSPTLFLMRSSSDTVRCEPQKLKCA